MAHNDMPGFAAIVALNRSSDMWEMPEIFLYRMHIPRAYSGIICDDENRVILYTQVEVACMVIEWEKNTASRWISNSNAVIIIRKTTEKHVGRSSWLGKSEFSRAIFAYQKDPDLMFL